MYSKILIFVKQCKIFNEQYKYYIEYEISNSISIIKYVNL